MKINGFAMWAGVALAAGLLAPPVLRAQPQRFSAVLLGDDEVPPNNTAGKATFEMDVNGSTINFTLTYSNLSAAPAAAHLHFAPTKVSGGVMIWLCGGGGQAACPAATSGTVTGTITAANVTGPTGQGIAAGDLTAALEAVGEGLSYANMHTANFPAGEIRGQVLRKARRGRDN